MVFSLETLATEGVSNGNGEEAETCEQQNDVQHGLLRAIRAHRLAADRPQRAQSQFWAKAVEPMPGAYLARAAYKIEIRARPIS
jgi:hypothetical protein